MKRNFTILLLLSLFLVACKNDKKEDMTDSSQQDVEYQHLTDEVRAYDVQQIATGVMTLNKVFLTYVDLGARHSQYDPVRIFLDRSKREVEPVFKKTEEVFTHKKLTLSDNNWSKLMVNDLKEGENSFKNADGEEFEKLFVQELKDFLKNNSLMLEKSVKLSDKEEDIREIIRKNTELYHELFAQIKKIDQELNN